MKYFIKKASINYTIYLFIQDSSATTGIGLSGLVYNSAGLTCHYVRPLAAAVALTLATQTVTGAHSDGGFVEIDATNMKGWYRLDLSDAILATGVNSVGIHLQGASNMAPLPLEIQLTDLDVNDSVRGGMTALPNAAADAAGGMPISDTGGLDLDTLLGYLTAAVATASALATAQNDLDTLTGADGVTLATSQPNYAPNTVVPDAAGVAPTAVEMRAEMDTNSADLNTLIIDLATAQNDLDTITGANGVILTASQPNYAPATATALATMQGNVTDILADTGVLITRITSTLFSGITSLAEWIGLLAGKQTGDTTARTEIRATGAGSGTYDETTDSGEATRDRGDAAWTTGAGGTPPDLLQSTTIATLASQISFTLTAGSADDGAYGDNGAHMAICVITDQSTSTQKCIGTISNYTGATKTIAMVRDPGIFTIAVGDTIDIIAGATASSVADEKYTGATHAIVDSQARRLKNLQEFGTYEDGAIWIDTINGSSGTTDYESGTILNPVDNMADANTLATSLGLARFRVMAGSSITFAASQDNQEFEGDSWTLALGGQSISASHISGATVSGICTGANPPEFHECTINTVTIPPCNLKECDMGGTITLPVGVVHIHHCAGESGLILDYGAAVANTIVHSTDFSGDAVVDNLGQNGTDILTIRGHGKITYNASCVGGTVNWDGHFTETNNGSGITFNKDDISTNVSILVSDLQDGGRLDLLIDGIVADANELQTNQGNWTTAVGFSTHTAADIWAAATRVLTAGTNIALAKGTGVTGFNDLSAAQVNTECDTALTDYGALKGGIAMTEGYAADGSTATPEQMLYMIWASLSEFAIAGTTITAKKLDGSTTAMTFTLDDGTNPTSRTRAT